MSEAYAEDLRNSRDDPDERDAEVGGIAVQRLISWADRINRLEEERKALASDIKDIMTEVKSAGVPLAQFKQALRLRNMESEKRDEHDHWLDVIRRALGV